MSRKIKWSLNGVLSMLEPWEAAALRLGTTTVWITLRRCTPVTRLGWRQGIAALKYGAGDENPVTIVELTITFRDHGDPGDAPSPREVLVEFVRRMPEFHAVVGRSP